MAKATLTQEGIKQKEDELFTLSQEKLDAEAFALASDLRSWITDHFDLTLQEQAFLKSADEEFIRLLSSIVFVSVRNKIPVKFKKSPIITAAKRFDTKSVFNFDYLWGGSLNRDNSVDLEIIYT